MTNEELNEDEDVACHVCGLELHAGSGQPIADFGGIDLCKVCAEHLYKELSKIYSPKEN